MKSSKKPILGVLALQGAFVKHIEVFSSLGVSARNIRTPSELEGLDGLIIPGGESTVMCKMLAHWELTLPIQEMILTGRPVFGTCAGLILLADTLLDDDDGLSRIGGLDIAVRRNAYGRQLESFEAQLNLPFLKEKTPHPFNGVFIRAPEILDKSIKSNIQVLCRLEENPVLIQKENILAASFHPELAEDTRLHAWFLKEFF